MAYSNSTAPFFLRSSRAPFWEIALDLGIQIEPNREITFHQLGDERSRGHHFSKRRDVVFRLFHDGGSLRVVAQFSKSMKGNFAVIANPQRRAGKGLVHE